MKQFNEHTALPWESTDDDRPFGRTIQRLGLPSCIATSISSEANAAFIVEACNVYYANKAKAELVEEMAEAIREAKADLSIGIVGRAINTLQTALTKREQLTKE